jgi:hypothetical protein
MTNEKEDIFWNEYHRFFQERGDTSTTITGMVEMLVPMTE